jgi:hypothetical protein
VLTYVNKDGTISGAYNYATLEAVWFADPSTCVFCRSRPMHHYHGSDPCPHCGGRDLVACPTLAEVRCDAHR